MQNYISDEEIEIVRIFRENVYGRSPDTTGYNRGHNGSGGHWLEQQMGVRPNADNAPDLLGHEMKNNTTSKTTFGDWSPNYKIFQDSNLGIDRDQFLRVFGKPNPAKNDRYSWSGTPLPTVNRPSPHNGSIIVVDENQDISIIYNYSNDPRPNKSQIVPAHLQQDNLLLVKWDRENLAEKLLNKFGQVGWFKCFQDQNGVYNEIAFGAPMIYENWIMLVRQGIVFFDSGMYETNNRPYAMWRASNGYWNSLIVRRYPSEVLDSY